MPTLAQLDARRFADNGKGRYVLNSVLITPDGKVVATNGKYMAIIGPPESKMAKSFHKYPKEDMMVSLGAIREFFKSHIRIKDWRTKFVTVRQYRRSCTFIQNAGRKIRVNEQAPEGQFPNYKAVMPKKDLFAVDVIFNAEFLADIALHVKKYGATSSMRICVPTNRSRPTEIHAKGEHGEEMVYILMPRDYSECKKLMPKERNLKFLIDKLEPEMFPCKECKHWDRHLNAIALKKRRKELDNGKRWCPIKSKFTKGNSTCMKISGDFRRGQTR